MSVLLKADVSRRLLHGVITKPWSIAAGPLTLGMLLEEAGDRPACDDTVNICSRVELRELNSGRHYTYSIVTPENSDPAQGRLSCCSPLGFALLGKRKGERVTVGALFGEMEFVVDKVNCCRPVGGSAHA